ncbi:MAG TPA: hypothetical protein VKU41_10465 [Polyangiaceae bacterium]|nr:hypothetical protein [Polyangiaceae bacterium]
MSLLPSRTRPRGPRRVTAVELAIGFALGGSLLAVAVPTFAREIHASRLVEPVEGLGRIGAHAVAYAQSRPAARGFPTGAPLTPPVPPRGRCEADPPGTWEHPTWQDLDFRAAPEGAPHCFSFAFDSAASPAKSGFRAHAHADLDGDGLTSTFEITGQYADGDPRGPVIDPGIFVDAEFE